MTISIILPLISLGLILGIGIMIFLKNKEAVINRLFLLICLLAAIWLFGTVMMFLNSEDEAKAIFWDRFLYIGVIYTPVVFYHFSLVFCRFENKKLLFAGYLLSAVFLILSRTSYFVDGLYKYDWGVHTKAQILHHFFLVYYFIYMALVVINFYRLYKNSDGIIRIQGKYLFWSFLLFIVISSFAYLPAYSISIFPFPYISSVPFVLILAFLIFR